MLIILIKGFCIRGLASGCCFLRVVSNLFSGIHFSFVNYETAL